MLCKVAFADICAASKRPLTSDQVANIYNREFEEKKISADVAKVKRGLTGNSLRGEEKELAFPFSSKTSKTQN